MDDVVNPPKNVFPFFPLLFLIVFLLVSISKEHVITLLSSYELVDYQVVLYFLKLKI
jgi:hypothetical protein